MFKKSTSLVTIVTFLIFLVGQSGCSSTVMVRMDEVKKSDTEQRVIGSGTIKGEIRAVYTQQDTIRYDDNNAYIDSVNQTVVGYDEEHQYRSILLSEVKALEVKSFSGTKTASATVGVMVAFLVLGTLLWAISGPEFCTK